jgi:hypothetical protein
LLVVVVGVVGYVVVMEGLEVQVGVAVQVEEMVG